MDSMPDSMAYHPKISVVTPTFNTDQRLLRKCLGSVVNQTYAEWELCIADDASESQEVPLVLEEYAARDRRIKTKLLSRHVGIAGASNEALSLATGEFVGFLDHDDELTRDALHEVAKLVKVNPDLDFIYTDEDIVGKHGVRLTRFLKPDWSPELLMSYNYLPHFSVYRRSVIEQMGGFRLGYDGSQDYDLVLRFTERTEKIGHLPKSLYRWRRVRGSVAASVDAKPYAYQVAIKALHEAAIRRGFDAEVREVHAGGRYRVRYGLVAKPLVSILIPTRDNSLIRRCLSSIRRSTYRDLDLLVLDWSTGDNVRKVADDFGNCRLLKYDVSRPPSFSRIANAGTLMADGDYLIFLNDSDEVIEPEWVEALLEHAQRPGVGAVGGKLLSPDGSLQHGGIMLGPRGPVERYAGIRDDDPEYYNLAGIVSNCSAITADCMMVEKELFIDQGMFDEALDAWEDVDFCLRVRESGYRVVYTPFACLQKRNGPTRKMEDKPSDEAARRLFLERWGFLIKRGDPYHTRFVRRDAFWQKCGTQAARVARRLGEWGHFKKSGPIYGGLVNAWRLYSRSASSPTGDEG